MEKPPLRGAVRSGGGLALPGAGLLALRTAAVNAPPAPGRHAVTRLLPGTLLKSYVAQLVLS